MGHDNKHKRKKDETSEERDKRKLAKKAEKVAKMLGYSNDTNPFGDSNLLQPFIWGKKKEKDSREGIKEEDSVGKRLKLMQDIESVRKRREDREKELEEMDRLRNEEQRLREAATYGDWQQKEEDFHMEQIVVRSKIRLVENREEPIDILAKNILLIEFSSANKDDIDASTDLSKIDVEIRDPLLLLSNVNISKLNKLKDDIEAYLLLEQRRKGDYIEFWQSLKTIVTYELKKSTRDPSTVILHKSIRDDIETLLSGKTKTQLDRLLADIQTNLKEKRVTDISYWEQMLQEAELERARAIVRETHHSLLAKQLKLLKQLKDEELRTRRFTGDEDGDEEELKRNGSQEYRFIDSNSIRTENPNFIKTGDGAQDSYSLLTEESKQADEMFRREASKDLEESEELMNATSDEIALPGSTYWWQDKYRPRKPRYFNRVKTGYDWNKYNSSHYDHDNPPPKTVQGYKFTIFYPDLIDKNVTPKYYLESVDGEKDLAIIRFHAGPPYEDIAFKIVNREWEVSRRGGFRCVFERGALQLYFNFKRQFYRR